MKSLFHILGTLSMMLMTVLTEPQIDSCIDQILELDQQQLEHIGFEFRDNEILFQFSIDDLKQEFHLANGEHWTTIERFDMNENSEELNYKRSYLPVAVLNRNCKLLYSSSLIKKRRDLLPIFLKSKGKDGSKEFLYFFLYNKGLAQLLPEDISVETYLMSSEEVSQFKTK